MQILEKWLSHVLGMCIMQLVWSVAVQLYFIVVSDVGEHLYMFICSCPGFLFVAVIKQTKTNLGRERFNLEIIDHHQETQR